MRGLFSWDRNRPISGIILTSLVLSGSCSRWDECLERGNKMRRKEKEMQRMKSQSEVRSERKDAIMAIYGRTETPIHNRQFSIDNSQNSKAGWFEICRFSQKWQHSSLETSKNGEKFALCELRDGDFVNAQVGDRILRY